MKRSLALLLSVIISISFSGNVLAANFGISTHTDSDNSAIVTFDPNGGIFEDNSTESKTIPISLGASTDSYYYAEIDDADIPTVTREGYTFDGWVNGEQALAVGDLIYSDVTFAAVWQETTYSNLTVSFAGGTGAKDDPYQIGTSAQLAAMNDNLTAHYILISDIDLSTYGDWSPIGTFVPKGTSGEDAETPVLEYAFTGSFNGGGHTVSGLTIDKPEDMIQGLFGCIANSTVKNLTIKDATVSGNMMVGAAVGFAYDSTVDDVDLTGTNEIIGCNTADYPTNMVAGVVAAAIDATISNCDVTGTTVTVEDGGQMVGLVGGGLEEGSLANCSASGSVVAGDDGIGVGGLSGCAMSSTSVTGCSVSDVTITAGDNADLVGGLLGLTGTDDPENPTKVSHCSATDVTIQLGAGAYRVGGLVGGPFYHEEYASYLPVPTIFTVSGGCTTSGSITAAGATIGTIAGYVYLPEATSVKTDFIAADCRGTMTINGKASSNVAGVMETFLDGGDEVDEFLELISGTYQQLFEGAIFNKAYDQYWHDYSAAVVGAAGADAAVELMKYSIGGKAYGPSYQPDDPESAQFYCGFTEGVATITFDGSQISGYEKDGKEIFSHLYRYAGTDSLYWGDAPMMDVLVFESAGSNNDEFKYFFLCGDTPETTYHIEFRYGSDRDTLKQALEGEYAYWLAAGIPTSALTEKNEKAIANVIALFCMENLAEMTTDDTRAQRSAFVGTWDATDVPGLYCTFDMDGNGRTYYNGVEEEVYTFYAYDNDGVADTNSGAYLVINDEESTAGKYAVTATGDKTILTFYTPDGQQISYAKRVDKPQNSYTSSSGSSGGRSGVDSGGVRASSTSTSTSSALSVNASQANSAAQAAASKATAEGKTTAIVNMSNVGSITQAVLNGISTAAGMPFNFQADSINGSAVDVRISLNPSKSTKDLNLSASTVNGTAKTRKAFFEKWYQNKIVVVSLGQQGDFGQPVNIAAKIDLTGMDVKNLNFYSYNKATNSYKPIEHPAYRIDESGYLHFTTELAGDIIISDGPLSIK